MYYGLKNYGFLQYQYKGNPKSDKEDFFFFFCLQREIYFDGT